MARLQPSTTSITAEPVFHLETDYTEIDQFTDILGFAIAELQDNPLRQGQLQEIANYAVSTAKQLVQMHGATQTKTLLNSIGAKPRNNQIVIYADARDPITGYPYGASVEYGFHPYGKSAYVPARPFLRPALEFAANATRASFENNVKELITSFHDNKWALTHFTPGRQTLGVTRSFWGARGGAKNTSSLVHTLNAKHGNALKSSYERGKKSGPLGNRKYDARYQNLRQGTSKGRSAQTWRGANNWRHTLIDRT